jgi:predicted alpha/beta superfamily hydrolase
MISRVARITPRGVGSPERGNRRAVDVYLPPSYAAGRRRYPVVYMHDGQNLSDPRLAFAGTWRLRGTLSRLARGGLEAIVVGVHHAGPDRLVEYSPFPDRRHGPAGGDQYLDFIVRALKPRIDRRFRTQPERDTTTILGSSMGALISLYAFFRHQAVFGRAGAMSPAFWYGDRAIFQYVKAAGAAPGRLYLDIGHGEGTAPLRDARRMAALLEKKGYVPGRAMQYLEDESGRHAEDDWARRLEGALRFLLRS